MTKSIVTSFETNTEGWTLSGDASSEGWVATGGNPDGAMHWVDAAAGTDSVWNSGAQFAGNRSNFYGGILSYDIEVSGNSYDAGWTAYLINSATNAQLYVHLSQPTSGNWNHITLNLDTSTAWTLGMGGATATEADIRGFLQNFGGFVIRAEYVNGNESGGLDNVALVAPGGQALAWNLFADGSDETPTVFNALGPALNGSTDGNVLVLDDPSGIKQNYSELSVTADNLTIRADTALGATLVFDASVVQITLVGTNRASVNGNALDNTIKGSLGHNTLDGSDGNDTITASSGNDVLIGGNGADQLDGGEGNDKFFFNNSSESTGVTYDTFNHFNAAHDTISLTSAVTGIDDAITTGALMRNQFDGNLGAAVNSSNLAAHHAVLFTATTGNLAGKTFLVVDTNGTAGYQHGDLVVLMNKAVDLNLTTADFTTHS